MEPLDVSGALYGVGVGPGDPELMTLKANRLIRAARVIAYPAPLTEAGVGDSFARAIAAEAIAPGAEEIPIAVPMRPERTPAQDAYATAAETLAERLAAGSDVVVLCEGDPLFYGSFMYVAARLSPRFAVDVTPGVAAPMAAAAAVGAALTARAEAFSVIPCTAPMDEIEARLRLGGPAALMKLGRRLPEIRALIDRLGLTRRARYVADATEPTQVAAPLEDAPETAPYFSLILITSADAYAAPERAP